MKILAIGCHPDDLEINCFGTLNKCVMRGDEVFVCNVANGCLGHKEIMPQKLIAIRHEESLNACKIIGAKQYFCINVNDTEVNRYDNDVINKIIDVIRKTNPDLIITHYFNDYCRDHMETSAIVVNAAFLASLPHYFTNEKYIDKNIPIYYMFPSTINGFEVSNYVDISEMEKTKLEALRCHKSQVNWLKYHDNMDLCEAISAQDRTQGRQCGVKYAEGFSICKQKQKIVPKNLLP